MAKVSKEKAKELILDMLEDICGDDIVRENLDINLLEEDLIDSLDYVTLLMDVEDQIGVVLAPSELKREEMDTPNKVIHVVQSRM
ncbi:MAG: D-alanine--poly(phosphoribitol) ligase subunit 2 [Eubacterium sp.]|jgi:D-alanine--poly(phosphoribitol) ligase subunit 2|nr:D-alanine--poly(phosphoribitol) ligase subunit 2 [Eubacterium sp.]MCH4046594.1 D-alanine--poly(phosphoribitol) ligase subunit 2 [Eubacterium sp.]MCH4079690.1 D-alanine--poly(phosphoribitol) ligase subunit 2 [Eubacterium sp.]MCH4110250.1 D-alanine--poly(phosphoribitol) ligase subunit 2 [Eubacterium sp.]MCI1307852.1 D-alanine--poly(phosphoribitol) ligase subunit 2 [Eubacterium sp.]